MMTTSDLKERWQTALDTKGLTQNDLASRLHVSRSSISLWIKNNTIPTRHLVNIAQILDISLDWLLHGIGPTRLSSFNTRIPAVSARQRELLQTIRHSGEGMSDIMAELFASYLRPFHTVDIPEMLDLIRFSQYEKTAIINTQGNILEMNPSFREFLEIDPNENINGSSVLSWFDEKDLAKLFKHFSQWQQ